MLTDRFIPTRLVSVRQRTPIRIRQHLDRARFRVAYVVLQMVRLVVRIVSLKASGRLDQRTLGRVLRDFCQQMGVLWIKVGQLISMRADLASAEVRAELTKLQDRVDGFAPTLAVRQIEAELGRPLDRYISQFEEAPIAAASVAQVHRAQLKDEKVWVAVKVRRPDIQQICAKDLRLIRLLVGLLEWVQFRPEARWREMLWELEEAIREELDFRFEVANMRRMRRVLRRHQVYVPRVFSRYCTPGLLVMEFVSGVLMSDYLQAVQEDPEKAARWRAANNMKPPLVARRLFHSFLRQTFEDNLFHSDLHPGNIVLLRNSRFAFLDFGSLGSMERDFVRKVDLYMDAMGSRKYSKMADIYFLFSDSLPAIDLSGCKNEMVRLLAAWDIRSRVHGLPFNEKSFHAVQEELVWLAARYGVSPVWTFFRMTRAMATIDASLRELVPDVNVRALVAAYYRGRAGRILEEAVKRAGSQTFTARDWTDLQNRAVEAALLQADIVRRDAAVFEGTTSQFAQFFARVFGNLARSVLLLGVLLLGVLLFQLELPQPVLGPDSAMAVALESVPRLDIQVWVLIFATVWFTYRRLNRLSKRFVQQEAVTTSE